MKKLLVFLLVGMITTSILTGCKNVSTGEGDGVETPQIVKIGVLLPMSGPASNYGADALNAYTYIVNQFNVSHTGLQIKLIVEDGKCEGKDATSAVQKLISVDKVQAIVGGWCSAETISAAKIAQQYGIPMLSPASSSPEISAIGEYIFKFYDDKYVTPVLANYVNNLGVDRVVALVEQSEACVRYVDAFASYFSGEILKYNFATNEKDFSILAKQVASKITSSDFLLFPGCNDMSLIGGLKALDREGVLETMKGRIASNEVINSLTNYQELGISLNEIKTAQLRNLTSFPATGKTLAEVFEGIFTIQSDVLWMVLGAEAMDLTLSAIEKVGNNAEAIKEYFTALNAQNPKSGYFGNYYFTPERNAEGLGFLIYEIQNGKLVAVE